MSSDPGNRISDTGESIRFARGERCVHSRKFHPVAEAARAFVRNSYETLAPPRRRISNCWIEDGATRRRGAFRYTVPSNAREGEISGRSGLPASAIRNPKSEIRNPVSEIRIPVSIVPRRADGFTLLEVLMALVIFALAAVVLGSAYVNVLNGYEVAARGLVRDEDVLFARQQVLAEPDRQKVEEGGEFDTADGRRAKWSVEITSTNIADLFNVAFTCEIPDTGRAEPLRVVQNFVLLRPTWSIDPGERGKLKEESKTRILELQGKRNQ